MQVAPDAPKRPALRYYGGKWKLAPWIISFFPPHQNYVEPCGGAASVLLQKPRSPLETYNDLDGNVVNFFRVLRDQPDELIRKIRLTPWARAEYELSWTNSGDELEDARRFFVCAWMSISNMMLNKHTGFRTASYREQCYSTHVGNYFELINSAELVNISSRFLGVQIENRNALYIIERYCMADETVVFFDPPYTKDTRVAKEQYIVDQDVDFHIESAALLRNCQGYVIVSGYACDLYRELYEAHSWHRFNKEAQTNSGGKRIESVWISPRTVEALNIPRQATLPL